MASVPDRWLYFSGQAAFIGRTDGSMWGGMFIIAPSLSCLILSTWFAQFLSWQILFDTFILPSGCIHVLHFSGRFSNLRNLWYLIYFLVDIRSFLLLMNWFGRVVHFLDSVYIHTGQHYDNNMSDAFSVKCRYQNRSTI
jgi:hypothetical protein